MTDFIKPLSEAVNEMYHLRLENLKGRPIPLTPLHDADGWHFWSHMPDGKVMHLRPVDAIEACYFSKQEARSDDFYWIFVDFLIQRHDAGKVRNRLRAIIDDVWCLSASLAKIELIHRCVSTDRTGLDWLVATELEYIVSVCRNMFDLLQEVISGLWRDIKLHGNTRTNQQLKSSFADMTLRGDAPLSADEISKRSKIPGFLAEYYAACAPFFRDLRDYRNKFVHMGDRAESIFVTERGFSVPLTSRPFADWQVWDGESSQSSLGSLRPVLRYIIQNTLEPFSSFVDLIARTIEFPQPVAPGHRVYFRGYHNGALIRGLSDASWWDVHPTGTTVA